MGNNPGATIICNLISDIVYLQVRPCFWAFILLQAISVTSHNWCISGWRQVIIVWNSSTPLLQFNDKPREWNHGSQEEEVKWGKYLRTNCEWWWYSRRCKEKEELGKFECLLPQWCHYDWVSNQLYGLLSKVMYHSVINCRLKVTPRKILG